MNRDLEVLIRAGRREPSYLARAVESIRRQSELPARVIIADQGAGGAVTELGTRALSRDGIQVCVVPGAPDGSLARGLNILLHAAETPWIAFLDDDDTWDPGFLKDMHGAVISRSAATSNPIIAAVCQTEILFEQPQEDGWLTLGRQTFNADLRSVDTSALLKSNRFTLNAALWNRRGLLGLGGFDPSLPVLEDWDLNVRASLEHAYTVVPKVLAFYHQRPPSANAPNSPIRRHHATSRLLRHRWTEAGLLPRRPALMLRIEDACARLKQTRQRLFWRLRWQLRIWKGGTP